MDRNEILGKVVEICKEVFDNEELDLSENTTMDELEEWDSLAHLTLISELEDTFNIKFKLDDIMKGNRIGVLVDVIDKYIF